MDESRLRSLLQRLRDGGLEIDEALSELTLLPFQDLGFAKVDHHRAIRKGFPEVIFGSGKSPQQITDIAVALLQGADRLLVTRASPEAFESVHERIPDAVYEDVARTITVDRRKTAEAAPGVLVVTGGTADLPVAREAVVTAELMDSRVATVFDVGVAGVHRTLDSLPELRSARVIVAVAGMDGVLPSLVSGLVEAPVIAVPTSVGYGAGFDGLAPLLTMMNACAPGVAVVNIDNGFGAGYLAAQINRMAARTVPDERSES